MSLKLPLQLFALVGWSLTAWAGAPKLIREINLNKIIHEPDGWIASSHSVLDIEFSPDEQWLSAAVGLHAREGASEPGQPRVLSSHVLIISLGNQLRPAVQIDPASPLSDRSLRWSPTSELLFVNRRGGMMAFSIPGAQPWLEGRFDSRLGLLEGFVDGEHGLADGTVRDPLQALRLKEPLTLLTFDLLGRVVNTWTRPQYSSIEAVSPERHLLAMADEGDRGPAKRYLIDSRTKSTVRSWAKDGPFSKQYFAEAGRTVCSVGTHGRQSQPAQCWDVDSGAKIAEFLDFPGGAPTSVSSQSSRLVLTHIRFFPGVDEESDKYSYKERILWDFRAGRSLAAWVPKSQVVETGLGTSHDNFREWGPFSISSSGRYLAEGSNGILRIFELP
jgi:hypothetical protein